MANLMDVIKAELAKSGIEEAVAVNVQYKDGTSLQLTSDAHPALQQEVGEGEESVVKEVTFSQSAKAGAR